MGRKPTDSLRPETGWEAVVEVATIHRHCQAMKSNTGKLPKGQGYPLKPSALGAAFADAGIEIDVHLMRSAGDLFDAHFWPPNENVPYERLYIRAGSVPTADLAEMRRKIESLIIPTLVDWISGILAQDRKSPTRREQQVISLRPK